MGKFYDDIPESQVKWIEKQQMFWVATAPLSAQGHVNLSPKGMADYFHVVDSKQVWYEDLTGSGVETIAHVRENGRITIMFCAFEGPPRILRLFGVGTVHEYGSPEYSRLIPAASRKPGTRSVVVIDVYQVGSSCGYAVPLYDFVMHRTQLLRWSAKAEDGDRLAAAHDREQSDRARDDAATKGGVNGNGSKSPYTLRTYWLFKNTHSLDGLPGLRTAPDAMLGMTPQDNFDRDTPRPMLRRPPQAEVSNAFRDRAWFASGFGLGVVSVLVVIALSGTLRENISRFS